MSLGFNNFGDSGTRLHRKQVKWLQIDKQIQSVCQLCILSVIYIKIAKIVDHILDFQACDTLRVQTKKFNDYIFIFCLELLNWKINIECNDIKFSHYRVYFRPDMQRYFNVGGWKKNIVLIRANITCQS